MAAMDTSPDLRRRLSGIFASMTGADRLVYALEMADEAKLLAVAGIQTRRPDWTDAEVAFEWLRLLHGDDLADRVARCSSSS